jgi:short-subunit dehydrogenase
VKSNMFSNQVIIITGASAGIGKALALMAARQNAKVVIAARRAERLEELASEIRSFGGQVLAIPTDVSDESQCRALIDKTIKEFGRLDMLINNAGLAASSMFEDFPDLRLFKHTMDVNFYGAVYCTYYALPHLKKTKGRIVAISSVGGKAAIPYNTPYCSSKYAMHGFYDSLRMELTPAGVSVTVICPWWVVTEFHESQMDKNGMPRGPQGRAVYNKKMMTSERCAELVLQAAEKRRHEVLMGPGKLTVWLKLISPRLLDWLAIKVILEPVIRKANAGKIEVK